MNLVSGGLADSNVKSSSEIPWRMEILELIAGMLDAVVEAWLAAEPERFMGDIGRRKGGSDDLLERVGVSIIYEKKGEEVSRVNGTPQRDLKCLKLCMKLGRRQRGYICCVCVPVLIISHCFADQSYLI